MGLKEIIEDFKSCNGKYHTFISDELGYTNEYSFNNVAIAFAFTDKAAENLEKLCNHIEKDLAPVGVYSINMQIPGGMDMSVVSDPAMDETKKKGSVNNVEFAITDQSPDEVEEKFPSDERGYMDIDVTRFGVQFNFYEKHTDEKISKYVEIDTLKQLLAMAHEEAQSPAP